MLLRSARMHSSQKRSFKVISQERICETEMSLVDNERQTELKPRTEHRAVMSSRGEMQQLEMNDGRRLQDGMSERVAGMMMTIEDGGQKGDRRREPADPDMAVQDHAALETS